MSKLEDVSIELKPYGLGKVSVGGHELTNVRRVDITAEAGEISRVTLELIPGGGVSTFAQAEVTAELKPGDEPVA